MNKTPWIAVLTALALGAPASASAVEEHHPEQQTGATQGVPAAQKAISAPSAKADKAVRKLKDNTRKLQAQAEKIAQSRDPKERQKLLREHMQTMRESMMAANQAMMMEGPQDCMAMMGGAPGGGMMGGEMMGDMMKHHATMEKRMDMMQMTLDQLMKSQGQPTPAK